MVEESTAASYQLAEEAVTLEKLVGQFQTGGPSAPRSGAQAKPSLAVAPRPLEKPASAAKPVGLRPVARIAPAQGNALRKPAAEPDWDEF
jgi:hypothetical protein